MPVGKAGELRAFASVGRYLQGPGAIAWLPQMTQRLGKSAAMLMGTHFYNREIDRIRGLFTEVKMEVTLHKISGSCTALEVEALKRMIAELPSQPEVIIGLGGGKTLDTVRIVAAQLDKAMLLIPTSVATNAATSGLSVMYDEVHRAKTVYLRRNPDCILVDTEFVIQGSPRMLAAGIGDSLATYFEARNNWLANNINTVMPGYRQTLCGRSIAEACVETLLKNGESAYCAVQHGLRTEEFEDICNFMPDTESVGQGFRPATSFLNESSHALQRAGRLDFIPAEYWLYHKIGSRALACNVSFLEVSKPDEHGFMSMGTCTDFARGACADAQLVIVETNSNFPFVPGSNLIHVSEVDYIVDADAENYVMVSPGTDIDEESLPTYKAIGGYLSELIPDEATIEVGLGRLNAASLMYLAPKRDLGVHTEVFGDILMHLTETGVITNLKKSEKRGRSVFTQVSGTEELYRWLDHNQGVEMNNCQEVLNPGTIARQHRMTAINNAVEVDLLGQANSEFLKGKQHSGTGGICNFASAAASNLEGKSIVVLESITRNGKFSKIKPFFAPGTPVTLPRTLVEYVVTEQGIARLVGKSPSERAKALIGVAHPKFREELTYQARELGLL